MYDAKKWKWLRRKGLKQLNEAEIEKMYGSNPYLYHRILTDYWNGRFQYYWNIYGQVGFYSEQYLNQLSLKQLKKIRRKSIRLAIVNKLSGAALRLLSKLWIKQ